MVRGSLNLFHVLWQALRPLFIVLSLLTLAFSLIVGARSFWHDEVWYTFLMQPDLRSGGYRECQSKASRGELFLTLNTRDSSGGDDEFFDRLSLVQMPVFGLNDPQAAGVGIAGLPDWPGRGFGYRCLDKRLNGSAFWAPAGQVTREWKMPLWALLVLGLPGTILGVLTLRRARRERRIASGCCTRCNYDLRGSGTICPECGTPRVTPPLRRGLSPRAAMIAGMLALLLVSASFAGATLMTLRQQWGLRDRVQATQDLLSFSQDGDSAQTLRAIARGANLAIDDGEPLRRMAIVGDATSMREMIRRGVDVNLHFNGHRPLDLAVEYNRVNCAKLLLDSGAALEFGFVDQEGIFLLLSRDPPDNRMLRLLIDHHLDLAGRDQAGCTPLLRAVLVGNVEAIRMLLDAGADANAGIDNDLIRDGQTSLHVLANEWNYWEPEERRIEVLRMLLARHANVNARDAVDRTPLHLAVASEAYDLVKLLVEHGADLSARSQNGSRPVDLLDEDKPEILKLLTPTGAQSQPEAN